MENRPRKILILAGIFVLFSGNGLASDRDISQCIVPGDIINNRYPVTINFGGCNIILPAELGAAELKFIKPKLIDIRTIKEPADGDNGSWLNASAVLSVESISFEHVKEPAVKARVQSVSALLRIGDTKINFRAFQRVELAENEPGAKKRGWLGRVGDSGPLTINSGETKFHTTMFRPTEELSWQKLLSLIAANEIIRVDMFAYVSANGDEQTVITTFCGPSLRRTKERISQFQKSTKLEPARIHIYCDGR